MTKPWKSVGAAGDVAKEGAVGRVDLQPRGRVLHADEHLALRADGDVAVHVAELRPPGRQLQPVGDGAVAGAHGRDGARGEQEGECLSHGPGDYHAAVVRATIASVICAAWCGAVALSAQKPSIPAPGAAFLVRSLSSGAVSAQARPDILDTPLLPGSIAKAATLVAALESGVDHASHRAAVPAGRDGRRPHLHVHPPRPQAAALAGRGAGPFVQRLLRLAGAVALAGGGERGAAAAPGWARSPRTRRSRPAWWAWTGPASRRAR